MHKSLPLRRGISLNFTGNYLAIGLYIETRHCREAKSALFAAAIMEPVQTNTRNLRKDDMITGNYGRNPVRFILYQQCSAISMIRRVVVVGPGIVKTDFGRRDN